MREIRVESLQKLKVTNGEVRMLPNSGELFLAFPRRLFKGALAQASATLEPAEELMALKERPQGARQGEFLATVLEDISDGYEGSEQQFDPVLRPEGMFAATSGHLFVRVVEQEQIELFTCA
jgi:hypothetical protein